MWVCGWLAGTTGSVDQESFSANLCCAQLVLFICLGVIFSRILVNPSCSTFSSSSLSDLCLAHLQFVFFFASLILFKNKSFQQMLGIHHGLTLFKTHLASTVSIKEFTLARVSGLSVREAATPSAFTPDTVMSLRKATQDMTGNTNLF